MKTLLTMVTDAEKELGLPVSTGIATDATAIQLTALANRVLDELRRMHKWTATQFEYNLVVDTATAATGDMTAASNTITALSVNTAFLTAGGAKAIDWQVSGNGIPAAARVATVAGANSVTMSMENFNTAAVTGTDLKFSRDTYPVPSDFDFFNNRTMWDRTNRWELFGPDSPQMDQWHRSGIVVTGPRRHFRKIGPYTSSFRIWPSPAEIANPLQLVYEYLSLNSVNEHGAGTTFTQYFVNADDTPLLDDQAITMGMKWMFWEIKGFGSYVTLQNRWVDYVDRLIARDGAAKTLQLVRRINPLFLSPSNIADGFWPGPTGPNMS